MKYHLIIASDVVDFEIKVTHKLREGWTLHGSHNVVAYTGEYKLCTIYSQAVVLRETNLDSIPEL